MSLGTVVEVIGAVVDVEFPRAEVPKINDALKLVDGDLVFEVQQQYLVAIAVYPYHRLELMIRGLK
mgnify:CR=1 FL=1